MCAFVVLDCTVEVPERMMRKFGKNEEEKGGTYENCWMGTFGSAKPAAVKSDAWNF